MKAGPLSASRTAEVATATVRRAALPSMMARKSRNASMVRLMAVGLNVRVLSSRCTNRREARLEARMRRLPWGSTPYTTTRPELDPMSMTATGAGFIDAGVT
jgi:hypothetical protein